MLGLITLKNLICYIFEHFFLKVDVMCVSASTNLVGKFTQSVRRIVQDVKDEGTSSKSENVIYFTLFFSFLLYEKTRTSKIFTNV